MFRIETLSANHRHQHLSSAGNGRYRQSPYNPNSPEVVDYYNQFARLNSSINDIPEPYRGWVKTYRQYTAPGGIYNWTNNIELFAGDQQGWKNFLTVMASLPKLVNPNFDPVVRGLLEAAHADAADKRAFTLTFVRDHYINAQIIYFFCKYKGNLDNTPENTFKLAQARNDALNNFNTWYKQWYQATNDQSFWDKAGIWVKMAVAIVGTILTGGEALPALGSFLQQNQDEIYNKLGLTGSNTGTGTGNTTGTGSSSGGTFQTAGINPLVILAIAGIALPIIMSKK